MPARYAGYCISEKNGMDKNRLGISVSKKSRKQRCETSILQGLFERAIDFKKNISNVDLT